MDKRKRPHAEEHKRKIALSHIGMKSSPESIEKIRLSKIGVPSSSSSKFKKGKVGIWKGKKLPKEIIAKIVATRRKNGSYTAPKGSENHFWKGGISLLNERIRHSSEYRLWRIAIFERDNYTCIWCGIRGGILNADHIKPFCDYPELRFATDNGRTLCVPCHKTTNTYGFKGRKHAYQGTQ